MNQTARDVGRSPIKLARQLPSFELFVLLYDAVNRLVAFDNRFKPATSLAYNYNGLGGPFGLNGEWAGNHLYPGYCRRADASVERRNPHLPLRQHRLAQVLTSSQSSYTYFLTDALGSARQLVDETATLTLAQAYQPYGETLNTTGDATSNYAFAGEWRDASGLDYLRARYYAPSQGRFITKDVWPGDYARPLTLNKWNYVVSNPVNLTDPTGMFPDYCRGFSARLANEDCVRSFYNLSAPRKSSTITPLLPSYGRSGCWSGPVAYTAPGFVEGKSLAFLAGYGVAITFTPAWELVYDFATMERQPFRSGAFGLASGTGATISGIQYHGTVFKFENVTSLEKSYEGYFVYGAIGLGASFFVSVGVQGFLSLTNDVGGVSQFYGYTLFGYNADPLTIEVGGGHTTHNGSAESYVSPGHKVNGAKLVSDILLGNNSPADFTIPTPALEMRDIGAVIAWHYIWIHDEIYVNSK